MQDLKRFEHFRFVLQIGIDQAYQSKKACNQRTIQFSAGISTEQQKEEKAPATVKLDKMTEFFSSSARHLLRKPESKDYFYLPSGERTLSERFEAPPVPIPIA
jgi:hypothetical protein